MVAKVQVNNINAKKLTKQLNDVAKHNDKVKQLTIT